MTRKLLVQLNNLYRAAAARALYTTEWEDGDDLRDCLEEALAVRDAIQAQAWFDRWPV